MSAMHLWLRIERSVLVLLAFPRGFGTEQEGATQSEVRAYGEHGGCTGACVKTLGACRGRRKPIIGAAHREIPRKQRCAQKSSTCTRLCALCHVACKAHTFTFRVPAQDAIPDNLNEYPRPSSSAAGRRLRGLSSLHVRELRRFHMALLPPSRSLEVSQSDFILAD
ncbi:hypothetical protein DFH11DRAFT_1632245 [Phellopilus nigrolimitatus]|nr:hypothetical protein DFH11DRAFT_1632245 [Phellopilus nigrolimitatus]